MEHWIREQWCDDVQLGHILSIDISGECLDTKSGNVGSIILHFNFEPCIIDVDLSSILDPCSIVLGIETLAIEICQILKCQVCSCLIVIHPGLNIEVLWGVRHIHVKSGEWEVTSDEKLPSGPVGLDMQSVVDEVMG